MLMGRGGTPDGDELLEHWEDSEEYYMDAEEVAEFYEWFEKEMSEENEIEQLIREIEEYLREIERKKEGA